MGGGAEIGSTWVELGYIMKILIIDDDVDKAGRVTHALIAAGIADSDIHRADDGLSAREQIAANIFDLVVVDILLPFRRGDDRDPRGGMNLLLEVAKSPRFKKPSHVLALTAYAELRSEFDTKFNLGDWAVDIYDPIDIGWSDRLTARATYIRSTLESSPAFEHDVLVLTALSDPELSEVRKLGWSWEPPCSFDDVSFCYHGVTPTGLSAVAMAAPRMGMVATSSLATKAIAQLRPRLVVMTGICAGLRGKTEIGDVVCASVTWDWQMGKYTKKAFELEPDHIAVDPAIASRAELLGQDSKFMAELWTSYDGEKPKSVPSLHVAPMASGAAVLADGQTLDLVKEQHRKVRAVDMEAYALCAATRVASKPKPRALVMKSVCDHGDHYKNDQYQRYCSRNSARVLDELLRRFGGELVREI